MDGQRYQKGLGVIGWILLMPFILIGFVVVGFITCEANKAYWDHKVKQLCEKDGGVTVYEKVELERDEFHKLNGNQYGEISIPEKRLGKTLVPYYSEYSSQVLRDGYLRVYKYNLKIARRSDGKVLGMKISYGRGGGDFPTVIGHPSSFSCAKIPGFESNLTGKIFSVNNE